MKDFLKFNLGTIAYHLLFLLVSGFLMFGVACFANYIFNGTWFND